MPLWHAMVATVLTMPPTPALPVPSSPDEVTVGWVRACLGRTPRGGAQGIERIGEGFGLSSAILRVRLEGDERPDSVVVKLWSTEDPSGDRETRVLSSFGDRLGPRVPACLHAGVDVPHRRAVLVLEDFRDVEQGDCLRDVGVRPAQGLARAYAALHGRWWGSPELSSAGWLPRSPWLTLDRDWFEARRELFMQRFPVALDEPTQELLDMLRDLYPTAAARLGRAADTLLHDDVHLDNVLFDRTTGEPILLDWARAARGPGVLDVAELLMAVAPGATEQALTAYRTALSAAAAPATDRADFDGQLAAAMLVSFVRHTCGVARWAPSSPREVRMIAVGLERAQRMLGAWHDRVVHLR